MKKVFAYLVISGLLLMSSCLVSSLHPFYKEKDKIFDPAMLGSWIDSDSCIWTIEKNMVSDEFMGPEYHDSKYRLTYYEEEGRIGHFIGTLFELKGIKYVDFYPDPNEDHCESDLSDIHHFPTHTLARVQLEQDILMFYWYGDEWLNELLEQNRIRIKHETVDVYSDYKRHLLTAPTDELQKFIIKYANNAKTGIDVDQIFELGFTEEGMEDLGAFLKLQPYHGTLPGKKAKQVKTNHVN